jgi:iron complex outermembrane receptor protein
MTDAAGRYHFDRVVPGKYWLQAVGFGNSDSAQEVSVAPGETAEAEISVSDLGAGETIVVSGSRSPDKVFDSPATVRVVDAGEMPRIGGTTFLATLRELPGLELQNLGINDQRIASRGFNNSWSNRMQLMVDGRQAQSPSSHVPLYNTVPASQLDIRGAEAVLGPASAMYGANAHTGVVNVLTKSPWDESGVSASLRTGVQQFVEGEARAAGIYKDRLGWKVTTQAMRAEDYDIIADRPDHRYGTSFHENELVENRDVLGLKAEGTLYYKVDDTLIKGSYGVTFTDSFMATQSGRLRLDNYLLQSQNLQVSHPHVFVRISRWTNDAGDSYLIEQLAAVAAATAAMGQTVDEATLGQLRKAVKLIDNGEAYDSEAQYRHQFGDLRTAVGMQWKHMLPDSGGTYLDEGDGLRFDELGGYVHLDYRLLAERLRLTGALRVDDHSNYSPQLSPSICAVFGLTPGHKVRLGLNRAFKSPTVLESHLYLMAPVPLLGNRTGYDIRDGAGNTVQTIDPVSPEKVTSLEAGYKGAINGQLYVDAVAYHSWYKNFISPVSPVALPMMDRFAFYPDGTPVAAGTPLESILFTYVNFGSATVYGGDLALGWDVAPGIQLAAGGSYIKLGSSEDLVPGVPLELNQPSLRLSSSITVSDLGLKNYFVRVSGRWNNDYTYRSGYWDSQMFYADNDGKVPGRLAADISAGYDFPHGLSLRAFLLNAFGNETPEMLGAPPSARQGFLQLAYRFDGLR